MNNTVARLEEMKQERHYTLGVRRGANTHYPSVGERHRFVYDPRDRTFPSHENHHHRLDRRRSNPPIRHRLGNEPINNSQVFVKGALERGTTNPRETS